MKRMTNMALRSSLFISLIALTMTCRLPQADQLVQNDQRNQKSPPSVPARKGLVNDYSNALDQSSAQRLESTLHGLRQRSGIEFAVVFVDTIGSQSLEDYSSALIHAWSFNAKDEKDGKILLLIAVKDYQWRFNTTTALEEDLPDAKLNEFGSLMNDSFSKEKYGEGVLKCVDAVIARLDERRRAEQAVAPDGEIA
jgi:uncharacterized protein